MTDASPTPTAATANTITGVFAILTPRPGVQREQVMAVMPDEIRATARLYLAGKIREWYSRGDGRGAVFLIDAKTVEEAESILEPLPLGRAHLVDHEYIPVGPLMALGLLLSNPAQR